MTVKIRILFSFIMLLFLLMLTTQLEANNQGNNNHHNRKQNVKKHNRNNNNQNNNNNFGDPFTRDMGENEADDQQQQLSFYSSNSNVRSVNSDSCQLNIECPNRGITQLKWPIYGPKGDQGPPGAPGQKGERGEPGVAGIPAREPPPPNFSAFFAALANNSGPFTQDKDLAFTNVLTNYGENYSPLTGFYTAPFNGVYQFFLTVSATGGNKAGVNLMKNGKSILTVWSESQPWSTSSQTIVLKLNALDKVHLRIQSRASHLHGYMYSSFGGSLLYEEINSN